MTHRIEDLPDPAALMASTLSLMTSFIRTRCPRQATLIVRQLAYLQNYPDALAGPVLKAVARRLHGEWEQLLFALPQFAGESIAAGEPLTAGAAVLH